MSTLNRINYINRIYVVALFGITPMIVTFNCDDNYSVGKMLFAAAITILFWMYNVIVHDKNDRDLKVEVCLLLLFFLLIVSTLSTIDNTVSIFGVRYAPEGFLSFAILLMILYVFYRFVRVDELTIELVLVCSMLIALIAICEFAGLIDPLITMTEQTYFYGVNYSTIGNRNFLGTYSIIMLSMAIGLFVFYKRRRAIVYICISFILVFVSQTRSAYIASLIIIIMTIVMRAKSKKDVIKYMIWLIAFSLAGVIGLYFISYLTGDNRIITRILLIVDAFRSIEINLEGTDRLSIWYKMSPFVWERPWVGFGPDTFGAVYQKEFGVLHLIYHKAHNEWLHIMLTLGIPYFLVFITLKYKALRNTFLSLKQNPLYYLIGLVLVGYIVQSMFNISVAGNSFIFYGLLGLALKEPSDLGIVTEQVSIKRT